MSDRTPLSEAQDTPSTQEERVPNRIDLGGEYRADMPQYHDAANFFELDHTDRRAPETLDQMEYLVSYAKGVTGSEDIKDALLHLKALKSFMGVSEKGKGLVKKMYQWARLDSRRRDITKEMKLMHE